jgi:hypothetical protein
LLKIKSSFGDIKEGSMGINELLKEKRDEILRIAAKHGARNIRVFGSVARGEGDEKSDIDFLVEMEAGRSLLDMGGLLMDLRQLLGREVDIVTEQGLKKRIRDRVLRQAVAI